MKTLKEAANATIPEVRVFLETLPRGRVVNMHFGWECALAQFASAVCGYPVLCGYSAMSVYKGGWESERLSSWMRTFQKPLKRVRVSTLLNRLNALEAWPCALDED
jgi:hypothetical protein